MKSFQKHKEEKKSKKYFVTNNYEQNHKKIESKGFLIFGEPILNHRVRKIIKKIQINYLKTIQKNSRARGNQKIQKLFKTPSKENCKINKIN